MNQRSLIAIIILAGIGSIGSVLAYTGTITANQGSFNNLLVTGTCTGCGGEASYTTYSTFFNNTILATQGHAIVRVAVGNDGSVLGYDSSDNSTVISSSQSLISFASDAGTNAGPYYNGQSETGKYRIIYQDTGAVLKIIKDNSVLQTTTLTIGNFRFGDSTTLSIGISPNGQYIGIYGQDTGASHNRLVLLKGS